MCATKIKMIGWTSLILTTGLFILAGCDDTELKQARQEVVQAKAEAGRLQLRLQRADEIIEGLRSEINSVRETRDKLSKGYTDLAKEKEKASVLATQAQQAATTLAAKADNEADTMASLKEQVAQLKSLVVEQQTTIQQQQSVIEAMQQYMPQDAGMTQTAATATGDTSATSEGGQSAGGGEQ
jgi:chromosome segregation ATPase